MCRILYLSDHVLSGHSCVKIFAGFVYIALQWIVGWFAPKKPIKNFPPIQSAYLKMPGATLAKLIRRRQITSTELVELYIDRIVDVSIFYHLQNLSKLRTYNVLLGL